jgi:hypothetical protein
MLYERQELPEIHYMKHLHDDIKGKYVKYDDVILDKTLSPYIFENSLMSEWLKKMQPLVSLLFDQMNVMKNLKNYMVDKYYYKQI